MRCLLPHTVMSLQRESIIISETDILGNILRLQIRVQQTERILRQGNLKRIRRRDGNSPKIRTGHIRSHLSAHRICCLVLSLQHFPSLQTLHCMLRVRQFTRNSIWLNGMSIFTAWMLHKIDWAIRGRFSCLLFC